MWIILSSHSIIIITTRIRATATANKERQRDAIKCEKRILKIYNLEMTGCKDLLKWT